MQQANARSTGSDSPPRVLTINGGSSSIKFALFTPAVPPQRQLTGKVERIGLRDPVLTFAAAGSTQPDLRPITAPHHRAAIEALIDWLAQRIGFPGVAAVGHRVVHGGLHNREPKRVTPALLDELHHLSPFAPDHVPWEIALIEAIRQRYPDLLQVACFDTAFHRAMPRVARLLPLPRRFDVSGIQRYGFHGLSYAFLLEELARVGGEEAAHGRVVLAHLGNGASLAAVHNGKSLDTSMSFTPTAGLPMGTRSGDLDPGLVWYLMRTEQMTGEQFHELVNHHSGLLGVSDISSDMRDLLARRASDVRAAEAIALFCYQAKKWLGAFAAVLGGLDTLAFSGGIGENAPEVRAGICDGLGFLGIQLDESRNAANAAVISAAGSTVTVRVIPTDEELMIAKAVYDILGSLPTER